MLAFSTVSSGLTVTQSASPRLVCIEASLRNPGMARFKYAYGIFTLICQYFVPFVILIAVYIRICTRIRTLTRVRSKLNQVAITLTAEQADVPINPAASKSLNEEDKRTYLEVEIAPERSGSLNTPSGQHNGVFSLAMQKKKQQDRRKMRQMRQRRTNILLTCVSAVFAISWLPLHAVNIFMDYKESAVMLTPTPASATNSTPNAEGKFMGARHITLIQSFCLLCILFSCCVNPLLYGYLNDNYKKEISEILTSCCCCYAKWKQGRRR